MSGLEKAMGVRHRMKHRSEMSDEERRRLESQVLDDALRDSLNMVPFVADDIASRHAAYMASMVDDYDGEERAPDCFQADADADYEERMRTLQEEMMKAQAVQMARHNMEMNDPAGASWNKFNKTGPWAEDPDLDSLELY